MKHLKVLVFPYDINPYQKLLYTAMADTYKDRVKISYSRFLPYIGALHLPLELLVRRVLGYKIVHIHWIAFYIPIKIPLQKQISLRLSYLMIRWITAMGYKIVWTVHDIHPHNPETSDDLAVSRKVALAASAKIVHSSVTIGQMEQYGLEATNVSVIPHGTYGATYTTELSRKAARTKLNLNDGDIAVLLFGIVKPYKGADLLVDAVNKLADPRLKLIIAGRCMDDNLRLKLDKLHNPNITMYDEYIDDSDVAKFFTAADAICAPFRAVTTSGSMLLGITFGKPIIAPKLGAIKDIPDSVGMLYDPARQDGLERSLRTIVDHPDRLVRMARASHRYSKTLSWDMIADKTYGVYRDITDGQSS